jgi:hypothetical protein
MVIGFDPFVMIRQLKIVYVAEMFEDMLRYGCWGNVRR